MEDDILKEFLAESWENLARLDIEIVELEKRPGNNPLLASIFRTIHTIKGTCGFIGLTGLGAVAHSAENVLGQMRDGKLSATPAAISLVLEAVDTVKETPEGAGRIGTGARAGQFRVDRAPRSPRRVRTHRRRGQRCLRRGLSHQFPVPLPGAGASGRARDCFPAHRRRTRYETGTDARRRDRRRNRTRPGRGQEKRRGPLDSRQCRRRSIG